MSEGAGRALITGVAGLIGSHLAERLLALGWSIDGLDERDEPRNLASLRGRIDFLQVPLGSEALEALPARYDAIFHLASRLGPAAVVADPLTVLREHAEHTLAVCERAGRDGAVVLLASSSEVYQWNGADEMHEEAALRLGPSHLPRCSYAVSKLHMEHVGLAHARQRGVRVVIARLFNTVGRRQRDAFVLPIFARQALRGEALTVHGNGEQARTFTHVEDAAEALIRLVETPAAIGEVVNVGAVGPHLTVRQVAEAIAGHVGSNYGVGPVPLSFVPYETTGDLAWSGMLVRRPDVRKLRRLTGLELPDRWERIVRDVCADWAERLGVAPRRGGAS